MKMLVVYDEQGDIVSVSLPGNTMGESLKLVLGSGQFVADSIPAKSITPIWQEETRNFPPIEFLTSTQTNNTC